MSRYPALFSPLKIKNVTIKNRVFSSGHAPGYSDAGMPGERYQAYHEEKAKGGLGLTIFGGSSNVSRDSGSMYGQIYVGSDRVVPFFRQFADRIHAHDTALMCQLTHMGKRMSWDSGDWMPTMGPSIIRDPAHHSVPFEMSTHDIRRIVEAFAQAAFRCKEGGLDGCELLATTHLLGQFLTPLSNQRKDAYGGNLDNRARFLMETLEACRERVGDNFIVGVRFAADESNEKGMPSEEGVELGRILGAHGVADFLNVNGVYGGSDHGLAENYPGMAFKAAPYIELAKRVKLASGLPTLQASRLNDPATADWAVAEGCVDLAGLTRAHMADPHLVQKIEQGKEETIRPCVGAAYCIDRIYWGRDAFCAHNISTGRESKLPHDIPLSDQRKKAVVIGGGPAGMEAARVLASRGHEVSLHEANAKLGGQLILAAKGGWRKDMIGIADWLAGELDRLGIAVHLNSWVDGNDVHLQSPDIVVVATGGVPDVTLPDDEAPPLVTTWDILSGAVQPADHVMVYDETGSHGALSTADLLSSQGVKVDFMTPDYRAGQALGSINLPIYLRNLYRQGVTITPNSRLVAARREGNEVVAKLWNDFSREEKEQRVPQIIVDRCTLPADGPFHELKQGSSNLGEIDIEALLEIEPQPVGENLQGTYQLFRIGDALASRDLHAAMLDANRLCRVL